MTTKHDAPIELWTSDDLAAYLRTTRTQIHRAVNYGHVPRGYRLPGIGVRWVKAEVEKWLAEELAWRPPAPWSPLEGSRCWAHERGQPCVRECRSRGPVHDWVLGDRLGTDSCVPSRITRYSRPS